MSFHWRNLRHLIIFILCSIATPLAGQQPRFNVEALGEDNFLERAWDLLYGPDDRLWVTERARGVVTRVHPETAQRDDLLELPDIYSTASQDGLLGMALHPDFKEDSLFVYLSYTYFDQGRRQKIVRYTYDNTGDDGSLSLPVTIIDRLPASDDHNSGRLIFGPDRKLYYTIGDQGGNQNRNYCNAVLSQVLPTQEEIDSSNWSKYPGKILRINPNGSIPTDNPSLDGVVSHIYSIGHRNAQGLAFASTGLLYSDEHGPDTDDEVNLIYPGMNYGWPNVAGLKDDQAYEYCNWSSAENCASLDYSKNNCPANATLQEETDFLDSTFQEPLASMFAVEDSYDFNDPSCDNSWICRPNVAPSSIAVYESLSIPSWTNSLLVTSLKRGRVYRYKLAEDGTSIVGDTIQHFNTTNRYRDIAMHPDGKTFYIITDQTGRTSDQIEKAVTRDLSNPGNILKFTLEESTPAKEIAPSPLRIYPNPASTHLTITIGATGLTTYKMEILSMAGVPIQQERHLRPGINRQPISDIPPGLYVVQIRSKENSWHEMVVIQ